MFTFSDRGSLSKIIEILHDNNLPLSRFIQVPWLNPLSRTHEFEKVMKVLFSHFECE